MNPKNKQMDAKCMKKFITVALFIMLNSFVSLHSAAAGQNQDANERLVKAALQWDFAGIIAALAEGADVNSKGPFDEHALSLVVPYHRKNEEAHSKIITVLLDSGADINAQSYGGWTALMKASHFRLNNIVSLLLAREADIEIKSPSGKTAIDHARNVGNIDTAAILEQEKARRKALRVAEAQSVINVGMHASKANDPQNLINIINEYMD